MNWVARVRSRYHLRQNGRRSSVMGISVTLRGGSGDMLKSVYDPNLDGVIAVAETEADMKKSVYDPNLDGVIAVAETEADMKKSVYDSDADDSVDKFETLKPVAGANLRDSIDANVVLNDAAYTLKKAIIIPIKYAGGTFRIKFSIDNQFDGFTTYGKLYKNGVAYGTERTRGTGVLGMLEFTEDLLFTGGDRIEFYGKSENQGHVENFRVYTGSDVAGDSDTWIDG